MSTWLLFVGCVLIKDEKIEGWVLDERKAYRQIGVKPDHRRWSVISLREPSTGKVSFFVMIGHSFGLVSAVYITTIEDQPPSRTF